MYYVKRLLTEADLTFKRAFEVTVSKKSAAKGTIQLQLGIKANIVCIIIVSHINLVSDHNELDITVTEIYI